MWKRILLVLIAVAAVTATAAAYYRSGSGDKAPGLTTAAVNRGSVVETVEATGTLEAVTTVQVGTQISGTIKRLHADFNSIVRKGQVIAELDPSLFQTQVEQARATMARLESEVERARVQVDDTRIKQERAQKLSEQGLIPLTDRETAEVNAKAAEAALKSALAQVTQARAALNQNQVNLDHAVIRSPIDGIVISRNVDAGQTVAASMQAPTLFVLARDLAEMQVNAQIAESDIGRIRQGQRVTFTVDAYPTDAFEGKVSQVRLQPVVEQNVVSYVTIIDVPNRALKLKPGMTASVTVEIARNDDVLKIPNAALRFRPDAEVFGALGQPVPDPPAARTSTSTAAGDPAAGRTPRAGTGAARARVWTLVDGRLEPVPVRLGITDGIATAVIDGALKEGAQIVTGMAAQPAVTTQSSGSPLLPMRPGGSRGPAQGGRR
jgi:HlyD family secretion protein